MFIDLLSYIDVWRFVFFCAFFFNELVAFLFRVLFWMLVCGIMLRFFFSGCGPGIIY